MIIKLNDSSPNEIESQAKISQTVDSVISWGVQLIRANYQADSKQIYIEMHLVSNNRPVSSILTKELSEFVTFVNQQRPYVRFGEFDNLFIVAGQMMDGSFNPFLNKSSTKKYSLHIEIEYSNGDMTKELVSNILNF